MVTTKKDNVIDFNAFRIRKDLKLGSSKRVRYMTEVLANMLRSFPGGDLGVLPELKNINKDKPE